MVANFVNRHRLVDKYVVVNISSSSRTSNMNSVSEINLKWELENVTPLRKLLFSPGKVPIAGRFKTFLKGLEKINQGSEYPGLVGGNVIPC